MYVHQKFDNSNSDKICLQTSYAFKIKGFEIFIAWFFYLDREGQRKYDFGGERDKNGIVEWMKK